MTTTPNQPLTTDNTKPAVPIHNLQLVPLAAISPNPNNPRKHFDQIGLKELADSIKVHGVRQPVLLRPNGGPGKFQLVCGERRWRASKIAGKPEIPAIVDPTLTDQHKPLKSASLRICSVKEYTRSMKRWATKRCSRCRGRKV